MAELRYDVLSKVALQVVLSALIAGVGKHLIGAVVLDQLSEIHKHRAVGYASGLPHVVRDDEDGYLLLEL